MKTIDELKKEFPEDKYFLVEQRNSFHGKQLGAYIEGNFEISIMSPNTKGAKQPVMYHNINTKNFLVEVCDFSNGEYEVYHPEGGAFIGYFKQVGKNNKKIIDIKELIDYILTKYSIEVSEREIDELMFTYGLKYELKCVEVE